MNNLVPLTKQDRELLFDSVYALASILALVGFMAAGFLVAGFYSSDNGSGYFIACGTMVFGALLIYFIARKDNKESSALLRKDLADGKRR